MNLIIYAFTKEAFKKKVISNYLDGYTEEDIAIKLSTDEKTVAYIIDCYNYLNN